MTMPLIFVLSFWSVGTAVIVLVALAVLFNWID
jgi:hypothetical protein